MLNISDYSTLFSTIHDEPAPVGNIGRGAHYSILRSVEWTDVTRAPNPIDKPQIHDFAVIWDEDHDTRVIEVIEKIYMAGLLSPVQFIGERKGVLSVVVAAKYYFSGESEINSYKDSIQEIANSLDDQWPSNVGCFDRSPSFPHHQCFDLSIIQDNENKVINYLKTIDSLWNLGTKEYLYQS